MNEKEELKEVRREIDSILQGTKAVSETNIVGFNEHTLCIKLGELLRKVNSIIEEVKKDE